MRGYRVLSRNCSITSKICSLSVCSAPNFLSPSLSLSLSLSVPLHLLSLILSPSLTPPSLFLSLCLSLLLTLSLPPPTHSLPSSLFLHSRNQSLSPSSPFSVGSEEEKLVSEHQTKMGNWDGGETFRNLRGFFSLRESQTEEAPERAKRLSTIPISRLCLMFSFLYHISLVRHTSFLIAPPPPTHTHTHNWAHPSPLVHLHWCSWLSDWGQRRPVEIFPLCHPVQYWPHAESTVQCARYD